MYGHPFLSVFLFISRRRSRATDPLRVFGPPVLQLVVVYFSYHTTHTTIAERRAEKQCQRRGASSGQKIKSDIEGEDPAAASIERFFSLKGPREENNVSVILFSF